MKEKNKKINYTLLLYFIVGLILGLTIGLVFGIDFTVSQGAKFAEGALKGSTIVINLNESELVSEMNKTFTPQFKEMLEK